MLRTKSGLPKHCAWNYDRHGKRHCEQGALPCGLHLVASLLPVGVRPTDEHFVSILHDRFVQGGFGNGRLVEFHPGAPSAEIHIGLADARNLLQCPLVARRA